MLAERYASYDSGEGRLFEEGKLTLEQVADYARRARTRPAQRQTGAVRSDREHVYLTL